MATKSRMAAFIVILFLLTPVLGTIAEPTETMNFSESKSLDYYDTGFVNGQINFGEEEESLELKIDYPSSENESGEMSEMAWEGAPFPVVVFFVDDGEELDNYGWITQSLASSGYIVVTPEDSWGANDGEALVNDIARLHSAISNVNIAGFEDDNQPDNFIGGFDVEHWGVGGHGTGGAVAAITQSMWDTTLNDTFIPPRALFSLGLDKSDMPSMTSFDAHIPKPSYGLFLTGTVDEIAPAHQNVKVMLEDWPGAWHFMEVKGANHLQYQDESGWLEGFSDGTATMSESEQQTHALNHISPYLDLVLKGVHDDWIAASNRETSITIPSDVDSYLEENLTQARLLNFLDPQGPTDEVELGNLSNFSAIVTHRNGAFVSGNNSETSIVCSVVGHDYVSSQGEISNGTARASCSMTLDQLPPGVYDVMLTVSVDGMPSSIMITVERGNTGMVVNEPVPSVILQQHGTITVPASEFAIDPDGQPVHFINSSWMAVEGDYFDLSLNESNMTISHTSNQEWSGSTLLALTLSESNTATPQVIDLVTQVTVMPVDDQIEILGQIPSQQMFEDGENLVLDISPWFVDPEGEQLIVTASTSDERLSLSVIESNITMSSDVDWHGAAIVTVNVSDGANIPVSQSFPVQIIPTDDEPKFNATAWNISFDEDETAIIVLSGLAWDPDGEEMNYIFTADDSIGEFAFLIEEGSLTIQPPPNWNGQIDLGWLNASDSNNTISNRLFAEIMPVNDEPLVQWSQSKLVDGLLNIEYSYSDPDSDLEHVIRFRIDDSGWVTYQSSCEGTSTEVRQCTFTANVTSLNVGGHTIDLVIIDDDIELEIQRQVFTVASDEKLDQKSFSSVASNPATWIVIIGVMLVLLVVRISLGGAKRDSDLAGAIQSEDKYSQNEVVDVIELDDDSEIQESTPAGLLAKAQNLQGKS